MQRISVINVYTCHGMIDSWDYPFVNVCVDIKFYSSTDLLKQFRSD